MKFPIIRVLWCMPYTDRYVETKQNKTKQNKTKRIIYFFDGCFELSYVGHNSHNGAWVVV